MARYRIVADIADRIAGDVVEFVRVDGKDVVLRGGAMRSQFRVSKDAFRDHFVLASGEPDDVERGLLTSARKRTADDDDDDEPDDSETGKSTAHRDKRLVIRSGSFSTLDSRDQPLTVVTWNIKDISAKKVRAPSARKVILEVCRQADVVFILEVVSSKRGFHTGQTSHFNEPLEEKAPGFEAIAALVEALNQADGENAWDGAVSNINARTAKCDAYAVLFRTALVELEAQQLLNAGNSYLNRHPWEVVLLAGAARTRLVFFVWHAAYFEDKTPAIADAFKVVGPCIAGRAATLAAAGVPFIAVTGDFNWDGLERRAVSTSTKPSRGQTSGTLYERHFGAFRLGIHKENCTIFRMLLLGSVLDQPLHRNSGISQTLYDNFLLYNTNTLAEDACAVINVLQLFDKECGTSDKRTFDALVKALFVSDHLPVCLRLRLPEPEREFASEGGPSGIELEDEDVPDPWADFDSVEGEVVTDDDHQPVRVTYEDGELQVVPVEAGGECFYRTSAHFLGDVTQFAAVRQGLAAALAPGDQANRIATPEEFATLEDIEAMAGHHNVTIVVHVASYADDRVTRRRAYNPGASATWHILFQYNPADGQGHIMPLVP